MEGAAAKKGYSRFQIWLIRIFGGCSFKVKIEKYWVWLLQEPTGWKNNTTGIPGDSKGQY
jgi:hypothetical protein